MIATLILAFQVGALFPIVSLPTVKTSSVTDSGWANAELRQLGALTIRATQSPARCRRAERLRRMERAIENAVEPSESSS